MTRNNAAPCPNSSPEQATPPSTCPCIGKRRNDRHTEARHRPCTTHDTDLKQQCLPRARPARRGDTCIQRRESASGIHLTVTVFGSAARPVLRSGAKVGDKIFVTGPLGGSLVSGRHLSPPVRIPEALQLRSCLGDDLHAMIDISDGLGKDAMAIASSSHVRFVLESELIPCHPGSNWESALQDGEDHELLFTMAPGVDCSRLPLEVIQIGRVTEGTPAVLVVDPEGLHIDGSDLGWNHGA